ncbi:MAG: DUF520 family protein, partial [Betaproteobacteria bacterium]|nr:DUF520 family protein [Betaproteobacteria bacterium]
RRSSSADQGRQDEGQASIQGDAVRVSGAKRDDLQEAIALVKEDDHRLSVQFGNFRD